MSEFSPNQLIDSVLSASRIGAEGVVQKYAEQINKDVEQTLTTRNADQKKEVLNLIGEQQQVKGFEQAPQTLVTQLGISGTKLVYIGGFLVLGWFLAKRMRWI